MNCYYCNSTDHEDEPCPHRRLDARCYEAAGEQMYPKTTETFTTSIGDDTLAAALARDGNNRILRDLIDIVHGRKN